MPDNKVPLILILAAAGILRMVSAHAASMAERQDEEDGDRFRRAESLLADISAGVEADHLFREPGVVADKKSRRVTLFARATGLSPGEPAEFILVGPASGHDYEAAAVTFAAPSAICRAIEFIGVPRGEPAGARPLAFWPKGERVLTTFRVVDPPDAVPVPLEALVFDKQRKAALPRQGLVYCGSIWEGRPPECVADRGSPGSVISTYNEPSTVLDLPHQASQSEVYERFVIHPDFSLDPGALLRIDIEPERTVDEPPRVESYTLRLFPEKPAPGAEGALRGDLSMKELQTLKNAELVDIFAFIRERVERNFDPYLRVALDDELTVDQAARAARALEKIEGPNGARIEAPPPGNLYYMAFLPDPRWRRREDRLSQPWELRVSENQDGAETTLDLTLVQIVEHWPEGEVLTPELEVREYPIETPGELPLTLARLPGGLPVLLVFAPSSAPLKSFMPAIRLVLDSHPTIHVFRTDQATVEDN